MKKRKDGLFVIQVVIKPEEKPQVSLSIMASGKSESSYLREMIGLDPLTPGAPVGNKNRRGKKSGSARRKSKPKFGGRG